MIRDTFDAFTESNRGRFGDNEFAPESATKDARSNLLDLRLHLKTETPRAIGVTDPARPNMQTAWLPKSQIEFQIISPFFVDVTIPNWLAKAKGLL